MPTKKKRKKKKKRNVLIAIVSKEDCKRYRERTVKPEKGKGKKTRPRKKQWDED
jgi:hypothetical protein